MRRAQLSCRRSTSTRPPNTVSSGIGNSKLASVRISRRVMQEPAMATDRNAPVLYGVLKLDDGAESLNVQIARLLSGHHSKLYVSFQGGSQADAKCATVGLVDALSALFNYLSKTKPRLYTVPLLPWAGWTQERISSLDDLEEVAEPWTLQTTGGPVGNNVLAQLSTSRPPQLPPLREATLAHPPHERQPALQIASTYIILAEGGHSDSSKSPSDGLGSEGGPPPGTPLKYSRVAVGGTFDRFHSGHMLLLAVTALVSSERSYAGITADALLISKAHRELLQSYEQREECALSYMRLVHQGLPVQGGALSDPKEPTEAESDPLMEAIVVSGETLPGAVSINKGRVSRAFKPLDIIVVPVIGHQSDGRKLSSTDLRAAEASP